MVHWCQVSAEEGRVMGLFMSEELTAIRGAHVAEVRREPMKRVRGRATSSVLPESFMRFYCYILRVDGEWAPYSAAPFKTRLAAQRSLEGYARALESKAAREAAS